MSSLDNITSKILNDAKGKAEEIVKTAKEKAEEKYMQTMKKYDLQKKALEENAVRERNLIVERMKSSGALKARNEKLKAKQSVIDKVIGKLKNQLVNMDEKEYIDYLRKNIDLSKSVKNKN